MREVHVCLATFTSLTLTYTQSHGCSLLKRRGSRGRRGPVHRIGGYPKSRQVRRIVAAAIRRRCTRSRQNRVRMVSEWRSRRALSINCTASSERRRRHVGDWRGLKSRWREAACCRLSPSAIPLRVCYASVIRCMSRVRGIRAKRCIGLARETLLWE